MITATDIENLSYERQLLLLDVAANAEFRILLQTKLAQTEAELCDLDPYNSETLTKEYSRLRYQRDSIMGMLDAFRELANEFTTQHQPAKA
jgi:hypothetical protein